MGSPKALLEFEGETFLDRLIGLFARHCWPVIAVLGAQQEAIRAGLRRSGEAVLVENPDFRLGQITSMQCGLRAVPEEAEVVLFTLVDHPAVKPDTITGLCAAGGRAPFLIPRYQGRRGHPILLAKPVIPEFLALAASASARDVLSRHAGEIAYFDVDDPGILADVDDPEAYRRLVAGERI